jgi:hypothetical protein
MNRLLSILAFGALCAAAAACGDDNNRVSITLFEAAPDAIELGGSTRLLFVVDPPSAEVAISEVGDVSGKTEAAVTPSTTTSYTLTARYGKATAEASVTVTVGPRAAVGLKIETASPTPTAGEAVAVTVTALAADGRPAVGFRDAVHFTSSDPTAVLPPDATFAAADAGVKQVMVTFKTAGLGTVTATNTARAGSQATATLTIRHAQAAAYELTALPATATAGESLVLKISARDMFGNIATSYSGTASLTSTDATDVLPGPGGFQGGVRVVSVAFTKAGSHLATVSEVAGTIPAVDTNSVAVGHAAPFQIEVSRTHAITIAGTAEPFNAKVVDLHGNTCITYTGTVHFTSNDLNALLPADYTFIAGDAGSHAFNVTMKTSGLQTITVTDTISLASGSADWSVGAAAAASCAISQAPTTAVAGAVVGLTVAFADAFGNLATTYAGTVRLTATDARAALPPDVTYVPLVDDGRHAFSASLYTTGGQTVTAADIADPLLQCTASILVRPAAPKLVVTLPPNANAGYSVTLNLAVVDLFGNAIPNFAGTVSFTNSDTGPGAVIPNPIVFTGDEGGVGAAFATFVTLGDQIIGATAAGTTPGTAATAVHGLVYSAPTSGRVRLVANQALSNTQVVQLDLIANERLEMTSFFGGFGAGSFVAGMNLPLDTTRVTGDATLFAPGDALPPGAGGLASAARIGATDHVLYTVVSKKREVGTNMTQGTEVQAGQIFYSVRLRLTETGTVGPIFDGAQPAPLYRAAVRDQFGDDFVNQGEFGLGKLEIR